MYTLPVSFPFSEHGKNLSNSTLVEPYLRKTDSSIFYKFSILNFHSLHALRKWIAKI